jgi:hypothetical protein
MRLRLPVLALAAALCATAGCAWLGPDSIRSSRSAYNDAIVATDSEQLLDTIVRMRYGEPTSMLVVSSVTANMHVSAMGGAEFGVGRASNYAGNLTPLSAGGSYEDNPTISYTPLQGEKFLRQLLSPVPLDVTLLVLDAVDTSPELAALLLRSIDGIQSSGFAPEATSAPDSRFARIAELLAEMGRSGRAEWVLHPDAAPHFALVLEGDGDRHVQQVVELHRLLGLVPPRKVGRVTRIPVTSDAGDEGAIALRTRSLYQLFQIAAASVEVPAEHLAAGIAPALPGAGGAQRGIQIHSSESAPDHAMTAIERHGYWYWIDASDTQSKLVFRVLASLMSVRLADEGDRTRPLLTLPVAH